ncbi:MAG: hypothetical protein ACE37H_07545 [Phycisphaeraceae bacterium]
MKQILNTITLACLVFTLTACGDTTTDADLPAGKAPSDTASKAVAGTPDAEQTGQDARKDAGDAGTAADPEAVDATTGLEADRPLLTPDELADKLREAADASGQRSEEGDEGQPAERTTVGRLSFVLPDGWRVGEGGQFREFTLYPPKDFEGAEVAVGRFNGNVGGFGPNVIRWARQAGVTLQGVPKEEDYDQVEIDGSDATIVPLINDAAANAVYAFWAPRGEDRSNPVETWTFKLTGSPKQVKALQAAVNGWAESVVFAPAP